MPARRDVLAHRSGLHVEPRGRELVGNSAVDQVHLTQVRLRRVRGQRANGASPSRPRAHHPPHPCPRSRRIAFDGGLAHRVRRGQVDGNEPRVRTDAPIPHRGLRQHAPNNSAGGAARVRCTGMLLPGEVRWPFLQPFVVGRRGDRCRRPESSMTPARAIRAHRSIPFGERQLMGASPDACSSSVRSSRERGARRDLDEVEGAVAGLYRRVMVTTAGGVSTHGRTSTEAVSS